jgi:hypothetical protein
MMLAIVILGMIIAGFLAANVLGFAMTPVGDAFQGITAVEFDGYYFRIGSCTLKQFDVYRGCSGTKTVPYTDSRGRVENVKLEKMLFIAVPSYQDAHRLYATPGGTLIQTLELWYYWFAQDCYYRFGAGYSPYTGYYPKDEDQAKKIAMCQEFMRVGEAWVYVKLDPAKLAGGAPILVELSDEYFDKLAKVKQEQARRYEAVRNDPAYAPVEAMLVQFGADASSGVVEKQVPFVWFPGNSTLKFKLTGLFGYSGSAYYPRDLIYHKYIIHIAPPKGKIYSAQLVTVRPASVKDVGYWTTWTVAGSTYSCYWGTCIAYPATYSRYVAKYTTIPAQVETRLRIIEAPWKEAEVVYETVTTYVPIQTYIAGSRRTVTMTYVYLQPKPVSNALAIETYTTAKEVVVAGRFDVATTTVTTVETGVKQSVQELVIPPIAVNATATKTMATATFPLTVEAPKTTVVIQKPEQVGQVNQLYQPPKPLYQVIAETLQSWWRGLLDWLQSLFKA